MSVFGKRLKEVRLSAGLSQERLGIEAGLDPMSASTRMNRYELGNRTPASELVERLAAVLKVPAPYFYTADEDLAKLILAYGRLDRHGQSRIMAFVEAEGQTNA